MSKVAQISILCRIMGNVNADWTIGQRIQLKKMQTAEGEVRPFVSARAIKHSIRRALHERGYEIDPFQVSETRVGKAKTFDSGDPVKYVDNDLFGFMVAIEKEETASKRQAPVAISYLRALRDVPVAVDLGLRAPRNSDQTPLPFEIEVADFVGRVDCLIYDYIGFYQGDEKVGDKSVERGKQFIKDDERRRRLHDFLNIFLTPSYVLPRRSTSLVVPEYLAGLAILSKNGPKPIYQYLDYRLEDNFFTLNDELLTKLRERSSGWRDVDIFLIDYKGIHSNKFEFMSPEGAVDKITDFLLSN